MNIKKKGFTLIELLVVVAIISMLTSVTLSSLNDAKQKGRDTGRIRALQEVRKALQMYATDNGKFPPGGQNPLGGTTLTTALVSGYISSLNPEIRYLSLKSDGSVCPPATGNLCINYWLGIALERRDNKVLYSDKDLDTGQTSYKGTSDDCTSTGNVPTQPTQDLCYDISTL